MMRKLAFCAVLGFSSLLFAGQTSASAARQNTNVPTQGGDLRMNTPKANETLAQNFVHVTFQLTNRGASPATSPSFTIQLDGNDPVTTSETDYTFTGLAPGAHTVTVTLVDANGSPIANSSVSTKFTVKDGNRAPTSFLFRPNPELKMQLASSDMSSVGSTPLPILSLVGFMVLLGGICTAIRSRR